MRRLGIVAATFLLAMLLETAMCFAGTLHIVKSYPHDGGTGLQPVNCAVKLYFDQDVSSKRHIEDNNACFTIIGPDKTALPITVLYDSKDTSMVLVVLKGTLESDSEYKLKISGDFMATSGDTLVDDRTITFKTRNLKTDSSISMGMMVVMFGGILVFSSRQMKRQTQKEEKEKGKDERVNPYKVAKKTGKSVSVIVEKTEKEKRKKAAAEAKRRSASAGKPQPEEDEIDNGNKRVKGPRPISAGGSKYKSGKKAKARAAAAKKAAELAAARAAGTTKPKNQSAKSKKKKKKK